jgi:trans-2,3-dihydro-3-hydroxyanthranilate isomerase
VPQVILPVQKRALGRVRPDAAALEELLSAHGAVVLYVVSWTQGSGFVHARGFFSGLDGVTEDPATGSAAGPLMAYLYAATGSTSIEVRQGEAMGRPSLLRCRIDMDEERVRVGGGVVVVAEGTVTL